MKLNGMTFIMVKRRLNALLGQLLIHSLNIHAFETISSNGFKSIDVLLSTSTTPFQYAWESDTIFWGIVTFDTPGFKSYITFGRSNQIALNLVNR